MQPYLRGSLKSTSHKHTLHVRPCVAWRIPSGVLDSARYNPRKQRLRRSTGEIAMASTGGCEMAACAPLTAETTGASKANGC